MRGKIGEDATGTPEPGPESWGWACRTAEERLVLTVQEWETSYHFSERHIVEFASKEESNGPAFRDHFQSLASLLTANPHPALLRLEGVGEEDGRLYRLWSRRKLLSACTTRGGNNAAQGLEALLDGLLLLDSLGLRVEWLHVPAFSADPFGYFIARLPLTIPQLSGSVFPAPASRPVTGLDLQVHRGDGATDRLSIFLSYLAHFASSQLTGEWATVANPPFDAEGQALLQTYASREGASQYANVRPALLALRSTISRANRPQ